jgi:steroid delta-isomerase-like uncharacterized protein
MPSERNQGIVRELYAAVNAADTEPLAGQLASGVVIHTPIPGVGNGRDAFRDLMCVYHGAFPEQSVEVSDLIADGEKVVARHTHRGVHGGEFMGMPATGRRFEIEGIEIFRVADDRVAEFWHADGTNGLVQQLGLAPTAASSRNSDTPATGSHR